VEPATGDWRNLTAASWRTHKDDYSDPQSVSTRGLEGPSSSVTVDELGVPVLSIMGREWRLPELLEERLQQRTPTGAHKIRMSLMELFSEARQHGGMEQKDLSKFLKISASLELRMPQLDYMVSRLDREGTGLGDPELFAQRALPGSHQTIVSVMQKFHFRFGPPSK